MDGLTLSSDAICTTLKGMDLVFLVLYAPLSKWWIWSNQCYMHHSLNDGLSLSSARCTTLQRMNVIYPVLYAPLMDLVSLVLHAPLLDMVSLGLYAPLFKGWTWSPLCHFHNSPEDGLGLSSTNSNIIQSQLFSGGLSCPKIFFLKKMIMMTTL